jgi:sporulation protein YlmC with PRC-barrel domain
MFFSVVISYPNCDRELPTGTAKFCPYCSFNLQSARNPPSVPQRGEATTAAFASGGPSYVKREEVVGKKAITPDGNIFGTVKDLAFSTKGGVGLVLSKKDESEVTVPIKQISAIGEFLLLSVPPPEVAVSESLAKPAPTSAGSRVCPSCGNQVGARAKFCGKCGNRLA